MKNLNLLKQLGENSFVSSDHHFGHVKVFEEYEPIRNQYANNFESFEKKMIQNWNQTVSQEDIILYNGDFAINKRNKKGVQNRINRLNKILKSDNHIEVITSLLQTLKRKDNPDYYDFLLKLREENDFIPLIRSEINKLDNQVNKDNVSKAVSNLNGHKILLCGNHDTLQKEFYLNSGWDIVVQNEVLIVGEEEIKVLPSPRKFVFANGIIKTINGVKVFFSHFNLFDIKNESDEVEKYAIRYTEEVAYLKEIFLKEGCDINIHGHIHSLKTEHPHSRNVSVEQNSFVPNKIGKYI